MIFLRFWIIGIVITCITKFLIMKTLEPFKKKKQTSKWGEEIIVLQEFYMGNETKMLLYLLIIVCIILVGGITVAQILSFINETFFFVKILIGIISAAIIYIVEYWILESYVFKDIRSQLFFLFVFIISIFCWTTLINNYNQNIEERTEVSVEQTQERQLLYFCNVPVQEITGRVNGSFYVTLGGNISGSIDTTHELTYWYVSENSEVLFDKAPANYSVIKFLEEGETPYVELLYYCQCKKIINHNIDLETVCQENRWTKYIFHLPETIMQYTLD